MTDRKTEEYNDSDVGINLRIPRELWDELGDMASAFYCSRRSVILYGAKRYYEVWKETRARILVPDLDNIPDDINVGGPIDRTVDPDKVPARIPSSSSSSYLDN